MAARRSLFLLVMKMPMKESVLWMMIIISLFGLHACRAAPKGPELEQTDATNSGSEPTASDVGPIVTLHTHESVDLNDVSSGYVSGSSGEYSPSNPPLNREVDRPGPLAPDQGFQSGDNIHTKDASRDTAESKSDTQTGDLEQMLKKEGMTLHKKSSPQRGDTLETVQTDEGVYSSRKAVDGMASTENAYSSSSASTGMLTPSVKFTPTAGRLFGGDDHDHKMHGVENQGTVSLKARVALVTEPAQSDSPSDAIAEETETTEEDEGDEKETPDLFTDTKTLSGVLEELITTEPESTLTDSSNTPTSIPSQVYTGSSRAFSTMGDTSTMTDARIIVPRNQRNSNETSVSGTTASVARKDKSAGINQGAHPDKPERPSDITNNTFTTAEAVSKPDHEATLFGGEDGNAATRSRGQVSDNAAAGRPKSDITDPGAFSDGYHTTAAGLFITQMEQETSDSSKSTQGVSLPRFTADGSHGPFVYRTRRQTSENTDMFRLTTAEVSSTTPSNAGEYTSPNMPATEASVTTAGNTLETSQSSLQAGDEITTNEPFTAGELSTVDDKGDTTADSDADTTPNVDEFTTVLSTSVTSSEVPSTTVMATCPNGTFEVNYICKEEPTDLQVELIGGCVHLSWTGVQLIYKYNTTVWSVTDGGTVIHKNDDLTWTSYKFCGQIPPGTVFRVSVGLIEGGKEAVSDIVTLEPSQPQNLRLKVNNTCVTSTWNPGNGHTDSYEVRVTAAGYDENFVGETNETSWTQCGLTPGASFNLSVSSVSNRVRSLTAARLGPDTTVPNPPRRGHWTPCPWNRQECITLRWAAGEGQSSGTYKVVRMPTKNQARWLNKVDSTNITVGRLEAGTRYIFRIRALSHTDRLSRPLPVEACTAPERVNYIAKNGADSTWIEIWWNPPASPFDEYILQWNDTQDARMEMRLDSGIKQQKIDGLHPGTTYDFRLLTVFCDLIATSKAVSITTDFSDLTVEVEPFGTSLNISWAMEERHTQSSVYILLEIKREDDSDYVMTKYIKESSYIYDTHLAGTCFSITLTPLKDERFGKAFAVHTNTDEAEPEKVTNIEAHRLPNDRTAINVTWSRPNVTNGVVLYYEILVRGHRNLRVANNTLSCQDECQAQCPRQSDATTRTRVPRSVPDQTFSGSDMNFFVVVDNLSEYENYDVEVVAATMAGRGPAASVVLYGQLLDSVTDFTIVVRNASCLNLTWNPPINALNSSLPSYYIEYESRDEAMEDVRVDETALVNTTETTLSVCGLEFWTKYEFNVTAFDGEGRAGKTVVDSERTAEHVPDKVVNLTVVTETNIMQPRKLSVRWSEPHHKYGIIVSYSIVVLDNDTMKTVQERHIPPSSMLNDSTGVYFSAEFLLNGDTTYTVQVVGATGAGNGEVTRASVRMPAGAVPRNGQSVNLGPKTSVGMETAHVGLPWHLLCDVKRYGRPQMAGYIVFREKWRGAVHGISAGGVSIGQSPVVTETLKQTNKNAPDNAYLVQLPMQRLSHGCSLVTNRTFGIPVEVGSRSRSGSASLCGDPHGARGGAGGGAGWVVQCGGGPLRPDTVYHVQAVMCTAAACTYSHPSPPFRTLQSPVKKDTGSDVLTAGMTVCFLLLVIGGFGAGYIFYKKRQKPQSPSPPTPRSEEQQVMKEVICRNRPVQLDEFIDHVEQLHKDANVGFSTEYELIKNNSPVYPTTYADLQVNKPKNRYKNILPWDKTRVELLATDDEEGSDYVNASYLPGCKHKREYIAAQGPLPGTIDDFWRMIWENRVSVVVMLTQCVEKGKRKCEQYWPREGAQEIYGDLVVHLRSESVLPDYIIRVIDVTLGAESRMIKHFHFMQFPDFGCPERTSMLLSFVSSVRAHMPHSDCGPMVVHCSAGVGRTGTFMALDQLLQQIHSQTTEVDIFGLVMNMREHRVLMVQTQNQYIYIHDCVVDALTKDRESDDDDQSGDEEEEHIYANC